MLVDVKIQRIGGSTFARLPPDVVKKLGLHSGDTVQLNILKQGLTLGELKAYVEPFDLDPNWRDALGPSSKYD